MLQNPKIKLELSIDQIEFASQCVQVAIEHQRRRAGELLQAYREAVRSHDEAPGEPGEMEGAHESPLPSEAVSGSQGSPQG